ncbi:Cyanovirin-N [Ascobolus immersus RN42]|uniref:Cyanovirin-N n=1 Tax=Ascobolus immersus RN42 TaxID=1160509 RepID=A0A3N4I6I7_ASCIM|nr:Cyanovirin-N [Ascobolus immersus RN42]
MPNFHASCESSELIDGRILKAHCRARDGNVVESSLDLSEVIGNNDGYFDWAENGNFHESARDVRLEDGHVLTAELRKRDGTFRERQAIELNDRIGNENGNLFHV